MILSREESEKMREKSPWLFPSAVLEIYIKKIGRTSFQGGLKWYRERTNPDLQRDIDIFAGKKIEVSLLYITGMDDWLIYQHPGSIEKLGVHVMVVAM